MSRLSPAVDALFSAACDISSIFKANHHGTLDVDTSKRCIEIVRKCLSSHTWDVMDILAVSHNSPLNRIILPLAERLDSFYHQDQALREPALRLAVQLLGLLTAPLDEELFFVEQQQRPWPMHLACFIELLEAGVLEHLARVLLAGMQGIGDDGAAPLLPPAGCAKVTRAQFEQLAQPKLTEADVMNGSPQGQQRQPNNKKKKNKKKSQTQSGSGSAGSGPGSEAQSSHGSGSAGSSPGSEACLACNFGVWLESPDRTLIRNSIKADYDDVRAVSATNSLEDAVNALEAMAAAPVNAPRGSVNAVNAAAHTSEHMILARVIVMLDELVRGARGEGPDGRCQGWLKQAIAALARSPNLRKWLLTGAQRMIAMGERAAAAGSAAEAVMVACESRMTLHYAIHCLLVAGMAVPVLFETDLRSAFAIGEVDEACILHTQWSLMAAGCQTLLTALKESVGGPAAAVAQDPDARSLVRCWRMAVV